MNIYFEWILILSLFLTFIITIGFLYHKYYEFQRKILIENLNKENKVEFKKVRTNFELSNSVGSIKSINIADIIFLDDSIIILPSILFFNGLLKMNHPIFQFLKNDKSKMFNGVSHYYIFETVLLPNNNLRIYSREKNYYNIEQIKIFAYFEEQNIDVKKLVDNLLN